MLRSPTWNYHSQTLTRIRSGSRPSSSDDSLCFSSMGWKDELHLALQEKADMECKLIGLKQVVDEFIIRLDFLLKCQASPEVCLNDLRDIRSELTCITSELQVNPCENERLRNENSRLRRIVDEASKGPEVQRLLRLIDEKDREIEKIKLTTDLDQQRRELSRDAEINRLKNALDTTTRLVERWKRIYHEGVGRSKIDSKSTYRSS